MSGAIFANGHGGVGMMSPVPRSREAILAEARDLADLNDLYNSSDSQAGTWLTSKKRPAVWVSDTSGVRHVIGRLIPVFLAGRKPREMGLAAGGVEPADVAILTEAQARAVLNDPARPRIAPEVRAELEALMARWPEKALGASVETQRSLMLARSVLANDDPTAVALFPRRLFDEAAAFRAEVERRDAATQQELIDRPALKELERLAGEHRLHRGKLGGLEAAAAMLREQQAALEARRALDLAIGHGEEFARAERTLNATVRLEELDAKIQAEREALAAVEDEAKYVPITRFDRAMASFSGTEAALLTAGQRVLSINKHGTASLFNGASVSLVPDPGRSIDPSSEQAMSARMGVRL